MNYFVLSGRMETPEKIGNSEEKYSQNQDWSDKQWKEMKFPQSPWKCIAILNTENVAITDLI